MVLWQVWRWAIDHGISVRTFKCSYRLAFHRAASMLLQSLWRETEHECVTIDDPDPATGARLLTIGVGSKVRCVVLGPLSFGRLEITSPIRIVLDGVESTTTTVPRFLKAISLCVAPLLTRAAIDALCVDFQNSFANLVLTRLLRCVPGTACGPEPVYKGHTCFPFPGLRVGPAIDDIAKCSNLCSTPIKLPLAQVAALQWNSDAFCSEEECFTAWSGQSFNGKGCIPIHPWQRQLSPIVKQLVADRRLVWQDQPHIDMVPLASQRTVRVLSTGFDIKLPVNATLTGEHRLLYELNCLNAPRVSTIAHNLWMADGERDWGVQRDIASLSLATNTKGFHVAAIIRAPPALEEGERCVSALQYWSDVDDGVLRLNGRDIEEWFFRYCMAVMIGPISCLLPAGIAVEPHLQNVLLVLRGDHVVRTLVRDLDGSVLDRRRLTSLVEESRLGLVDGTWAAMPAFEVGISRLAYSLFFGHLAEALVRVQHATGASNVRLFSCVENAWSEVIARTGRTDRQMCANVWSESMVVRKSLTMRLSRSMTMQFVLPKRPVCPGRRGETTLHTKQLNQVSVE